MTVGRSGRRLHLHPRDPGHRRRLGRENLDLEELRRPQVPQLEVVRLGAGGQHDLLPAADDSGPVGDTRRLLAFRIPRGAFVLQMAANISATY